MDIEYNVNHQIISLNGRKRPVNKSQNYLRLSFTFSDDWNGLTKFILFKNTDGTVRASINDDKVIIPPSMLTGRRLLFTVYGVNNEEVRITTNLTNLDLLESGYTSDVVNDDTELEELSTVEAIYAELDKKATTQSLTGYYTKEQVDTIITNLSNRVVLESEKGIIEKDETNTLTVYVLSDGLQRAGLTVNIYKGDD